MRRFRKVLAFAGACALALVLTIQHRGEDIRLGTNVPLSASVRPAAAAYDLSQIPIFTKALYYVNNNYFDKTRIDPKRMLVGALDFLQRDIPEVLIDRYPERDPRQVTMKVNGQQRNFSIEQVDSPWKLRSTMQDIFRFLQPNLQPVGPKEEARRLVEVEMTATNGMLYTLDPHSILLDVESFKDMRTTTQGKFGGLGIVIEMDRKNRIAVKKPMPDTPASRAGIRAKDHIVRINSESTVNMTLQEAVDRLRGEVGAPVDVYIERQGQSGAKKFTIVRDSIRPPAIDPDPRVLSVPAGPGGSPVKIGYFRIGNFSANTESDLNNRALSLFERERVKGIIMDLRGNPGGLYDQAQKVADAFIESGVLVSMVGVGGAQRKDEHATRDNEPKVPIAVLVNQFSASASEIVAGAIKNLERGIVIGETTFGKGSVQMLFDITSPVPFGAKNEDDKLGLKLTTAQYLTPGDLSIQGVGVTPDIELVPLKIEKRDERATITLQASTHRRQESDYEWHLDHPSARRGTRPSESIPYVWTPPAGYNPRTIEEDEEAAEDDEPEREEVDENRTDFLMEFARDLLAQAKTSRRRELLGGSKAYFDKVRADEDKKLVVALEKLGVDWSAGPANTAPGQLQVSLAPAAGESKVAAGNTIKVRGTVKNLGSTTVHRARAVLKSDNLLFDENEMVFGKISPGASKTYDLTVRVPKSTLTRTDVIRAEVSAQGAVKANGAEMMLNVDGKARPLFAYTYQTVDDVSGNRDGQVQKGERVRLLVKVKNIGLGAALKTEAILRNGPGQEGILISAGRFDAKDLAPGAVKTFSFVYEVGSDFGGDDYQLELMVGDTILGESVTDKIRVPVVKNASSIQTENGTVTTTRVDTALREAPAEGALVIGRAAKGATFKSTGRNSAFVRVELESDRAGFIALGDVQAGGRGDGTFQTLWQVMPPVLTVSAPTVVTGNAVRIKGTASDDHQVKDLYVRVWNRESKMPPKKVFYLPNRGDKTRLQFETDVPLWPGSNLVQVFARETNEVQTVSTAVVLQRGPVGLVKAPDPATKGHSPELMKK